MQSKERLRYRFFSNYSSKIFTKIITSLSFKLYFSGFLMLIAKHDLFSFFLYFCSRKQFYINLEMDVEALSLLSAKHFPGCCWSRELSRSQAGAGTVRVFPCQVSGTVGVCQGKRGCACGSHWLCLSTGRATEMFVPCSPFVWASWWHFSTDPPMDPNCYTLWPVMVLSLQLPG